MSVFACRGPWLVALVVLGLAVAALPSHGQTQYRLYSPEIALPQRISNIHFLHAEFDSTLHVGTVIGQDQAIGYADDRPLVRSVRYGMRIIASEEAYEAGNFAEGTAMLEEAVLQEPTNPFILYQQARCLYRNEATKPQAYQLYQRLVKQLDAAAPPGPADLNADVWFVEAYWKLGTLYMDHAQWSKAIFSISQFLLVAPREQYAGTLLHEQVLNYLTEAFSRLGDAKMCRHFGQLTLKNFPQNQYVRPYLARLPKPAGPKR